MELGVGRSMGFLSAINHLLIKFRFEGLALRLIDTGLPHVILLADQALFSSFYCPATAGIASNSTPCTTAGFTVEPCNRNYFCFCSLHAPRVSSADRWAFHLKPPIKSF